MIKKRHSLPAKWELKYPTPTEREEMRGHFESILAPDGLPSRRLTREESLWILAENTLAKLDYQYYSRNYAVVEDEEGRIVNFTPRRPQRMVDEIYAENELDGVAQMLINLKARQLGRSLHAQIRLSHRVFFYRNVKCMTGSSEPDKSKEMVAKLEFLHQHLPWWMKPRITAYRAGELIRFGDLNSVIFVAWGNQKKGIGRGMTPTIAHLSELGEFEDGAKLVDASLIRALHENPFTIFELEGTAERMGDWWNRTWDFNVKMDARGLARFKPLFLPWFVGTDIYPKPSWLRRRPVPKDWDPPEYIIRHAEAAEAYTQATPILARELGSNWKMPIEQKWFYHLEYEEAREKKQLHHFLKEMPANPGQAWQNANPSVFDLEVLDSVRTNAVASLPIGVYQLAGPSIASIYNEYRVDAPQRPIDLRCLSMSGKLQETFTLEPLRLESWPDLEPHGKIYIWEMPQLGEVYGIGVDTSEGVDQDRSVVQVFKKANPRHPDEQVAEFASPRVLQDDLWLWAFALAHFYTVPKHGGGWSFPRAVIETNNGGDKVQTEMFKRGWPEFHVDYDPTKTGTVGKEFDRRSRAYSDSLGWWTDRANRPKVISMIRKAVRDGLLIVRSPWFANELQTLEYNLDKKRIEASEGNYDDRPMAGGILLTSWYDPELYGTEPQAYRAAQERERTLMEDPVLRTFVPPPPPPPKGWKPPGPAARVDSRSLYL